MVDSTETPQTDGEAPPNPEGPTEDQVVSPLRQSKVVAKSDDEGDSKASVVTSFIKLSGYEKADIAAYNTGRRTVVTKNGGKYVVSKSGKQLKHLAGPLPPSVADQEA